MLLSSSCVYPILLPPELSAASSSPALMPKSRARAEDVLLVPTSHSYACFLQQGGHVHCTQLSGQNAFPKQGSLQVTQQN